MINTSGRIKRGRGFTLIELIVVVGVVCILAAIAIPTYFGYIEKARITVSISMLDALRKDLEAYFNQFQAYPASVDFTNFTDQNGNSILSALNDDVLKKKIFSWDSYVASDGTYTITVKAMDSNHTVLILTPGGIKK